MADLKPDERLRAVRAVLRERRRLAEACPGPGWRPPPRRNTGWLQTTADRTVAVVTTDHDPSGRGVDALAHIAAHDPATVLREVAAGRAMCDEWEAHITRLPGNTETGRPVRAAGCVCHGCRLFILWSDALLPAGGGATDGNA